MKEDFVLPGSRYYTLSRQTYRQEFTGPFKKCWLFHKWRLLEVVELAHGTVYESQCERCGKRDANVGF